MTLNAGDKVSITTTYSESYVMVVKKGQTGIFERLTTKGMHVSGIYQDVDMAQVRLNNGNVVLVPPDFISLYEKKVHLRIENLPSADLLERFEYLSAHEAQARMGTKSIEKMRKDLDRCRVELLRRLDK